MPKKIVESVNFDKNTQNIDRLGLIIMVLWGPCCCTIRFEVHSSWIQFHLCSSVILQYTLSHFQINHIYQFEFMSQHLVFANCIPLVLKFFNQNILAYIGSKNNISLLDFPSCVIGEQPPGKAFGSFPNFNKLWNDSEKNPQNLNRWEGQRRPLVF